jgi:pyruvate dehydrogenase E1 component beta subunit
MNFMEASHDAFDVALSSDPTVFMLGEDIMDPIGGVTKITKGLSTKYGLDRIRPTPISEQAIIGAAIGAALAGMRPIAEIMLMDFLGVCLDQIANHAAKLRYMTGGRTNVPMTIRTLVGGGNRNGAQHSQSLEMWLAHVPGLKVVCASTPTDAKGLMLSSIFDDDPVVVMEVGRIIFNKAREDVSLGDFRIPLGKAKVSRTGSDVTLVGWGRTALDALACAEELAGKGISVEVVDLRTIVPVDMPTVLESVARTRRLAIAHAAVEFGGFGAEIASQVHKEMFGQLAAPVLRMGAPYAPTPTGPLEAAYIPGVERMVREVRQLVQA